MAISVLLLACIGTVAPGHAEEDSDSASDGALVLRVPVQHRARVLNILENERIEARDRGTENAPAAPRMSGLVEQPVNVLRSFATLLLVIQRAEGLIEMVRGEPTKFYAALTPPSGSGEAGVRSLDTMHAWIKEKIEVLAGSDARFLSPVDQVRKPDEKWPRPMVILHWYQRRGIPGDRAMANLRIDHMKIAEAPGVTVRMSNAPRTRPDKHAGTQTRGKILELSGENLHPSTILEFVTALMGKDGFSVTKFSYRRNSEKEDPPQGRIEIAANDPWFTSIQLRNQ